MYLCTYFLRDERFFSSKCLLKCKDRGAGILVCNLKGFCLWNEQTTFLISHHSNSTTKRKLWRQLSCTYSFLINIWNATIYPMIMLIRCLNLNDFKNPGISCCIPALTTTPSSSFPFFISIGSFVQKTLTSLLIFLYLAYVCFSYSTKPLLKWFWWKHYFFFLPFSNTFPPKLRYFLSFLLRSLSFIFQDSECYFLTLLRSNQTFHFLYSSALNKLSCHLMYCHI